MAGGKILNEQDPEIIGNYVEFKTEKDTEVNSSNGVRVLGHVFSLENHETKDKIVTELGDTYGIGIVPKWNQKMDKSEGWAIEDKNGYFIDKNIHKTRKQPLDTHIYICGKYLN